MSKTKLNIFITSLFCSFIISSCSFGDSNFVKTSSSIQTDYDGDSAWIEHYKMISQQKNSENEAKNILNQNSLKGDIFSSTENNSSLTYDKNLPTQNSIIQNSFSGIITNRDFVENNNTEVSLNHSNNSKDNSVIIYNRILTNDDFAKNNFSNIVNENNSRNKKISENSIISSPAIMEVKDKVKNSYNYEYFSAAGSICKQNNVNSNVSNFALRDRFSRKITCRYSDGRIFEYNDYR